MGSVLSWVANGVLFVVGCFLAADTFNQIIASALLAPSETAAHQTQAANPARQRSWAERQIILTRNLFKSSTQSPVAAQAPLEEIEKSKLPIVLLGTFAASDPALSRATVQDREKNDTVVVRVGDQIRNQALVTRIERRRIVLTENGAPRELTFEGDDQPEVVSPVRTARAVAPVVRRPRAAARQVRPLGENRFAVQREDIQQTIQNPTDLLSQARVLPKFEDGQMVGLQVTGIKPGSLYQQIGIQEGDVITEVNGIHINSPEESAKIMQEFSNANEYNVVGKGADGQEWVRNFVVPQ